MSALLKSAPSGAALSIVVGRDALLGELTLAALAADPTSDAPVLRALSVEAIETGLVIGSTDGDVALRTVLDARASGRGTFLAPARRLLEAVRAFPPGAEVRVELCRDRRVRLVSGAAEYTIVLERADAIEFPSAGAAALELPGASLRRVLARADYAMTDEASRYTLASVKLEISGSRLVAVSTDGRRLAFCEQLLAEPATRDLTAIVPKRATIALRRMLAGTDRTVRIADDGEWVTVSAGRRTLAFRGLAGIYPAYEAIISGARASRLVVRRASLACAVRRARLMADRRVEDVRLEASEGTLVVAASSIESGEARDELDARGDALDVRLSGAYLADFLAVSEGERVRFEFGDSKRDPYVLVSEGESAGLRVVCVLMPMV